MIHSRNIVAMEGKLFTVGGEAGIEALAADAPPALATGCKSDSKTSKSGIATSISLKNSNSDLIGNSGCGSKSFGLLYRLSTGEMLASYGTHCKLAHDN